MQLSCPAKTFLLGEYLALNGDACLLAATQPRFHLQVREGRRSAPFHPDSPAGRLWARHEQGTENWSVAFSADLKIGGLGASSAEFLLLWSALQMHKTLSKEAQFEPDFAEILKAYSDLSTDGTGRKPSGADLVAQLKGGVTLFEKKRGRAQAAGWGFDHISFLLYATGVKVPTHEHLRSLADDWDDAGLKSAVEPGIQAWIGRDPEVFVESVRQTRSELKRLGFEASSTTEILSGLLENSKVLAAKGCGALGADVILVVCDKHEKEDLKAQLAGHLQFLASEENLDEGLQALPHAVFREVLP